MEYLDYLIMAGLVLIILFLLVLRNRTVREKREVEKKLEKTRNDLDDVYSEVNNTQEELNAKYREIKAGDEKIKKLAYEDVLTGIPNKAAFHEMLRHTLETLRTNEFAGVMYLDLDNFKKLDDLWGHANCDEFILDVSHRLRQNLDEDDYIARMDGDGDGFMILSQNLKSFADYDEKIKRLIHSFRFPFVATFGEAVITVSIGVTMAPNHGEKVDILLKNATLALAEAKKLGRDNYVYYSEELTAREIENIELKSVISSAIKHNNFLIQYEPIQNIETNQTELLRAKLLIDRKEKGITNTERFIHIIENMGFSVKVGLNVIEKICRERKPFPNQKIIVPLTEKMFVNYDFFRQVLKIVKEEQMDCSFILFEIGEEILTAHFFDSLYLIDELRSHGFGFVVGHYGNGRSSLDILRDMKFEFVSLSLPKIFFDHEEEESKQYLSLLTRVIKEMGSEVLYTEISDSADEEIARACGGVFLSGKLYEEVCCKKDENSP